MIEQLRAMLVRHEGTRYVMYRDSLGNPTLGVGHLLTVPITDAAVNQILNDDISDTQQQLAHALSWLNQLDSVRQDVLVDLAFNLGVGGLLGFRHFLAAMQAGDWTTAKAEMLNSKWATQVGSRAQELAAMVLGGEYQQP